MEFFCIAIINAYRKMKNPFHINLYSIGDTSFSNFIEAIYTYFYIMSLNITHSHCLFDVTTHVTCDNIVNPALCVMFSSMSNNKF